MFGTTWANRMNLSSFQLFNHCFVNKHIINTSIIIKKQVNVCSSCTSNAELLSNFGIWVWKLDIVINIKRGPFGFNLPSYICRFVATSTRTSTMSGSTFAILDHIRIHNSLKLAENLMELEQECPR
jgi:hypothetical protein